MSNNLLNSIIYPLIITVVGGVILLFLEYKSEIFNSNEIKNDNPPINKTIKKDTLDVVSKEDLIKYYNWKKKDPKESHSYECDSIFTKKMVEKMSILYQLSSEMLLKGVPYKEKDSIYSNSFLVNYKNIKLEQSKYLVAGSLKIENKYYNYLININNLQNNHISIEERPNETIRHPYLRIEFHPFGNFSGRLFSYLILNFNQITRLDFESSQRKTIELIDKIEKEVRIKLYSSE